VYALLILGGATVEASLGSFFARRLGRLGTAADTRGFLLCFSKLRKHGADDEEERSEVKLHIDSMNAD
jgi:hypothetical protein